MRYDEKHDENRYIHLVKSTEGMDAIDGILLQIVTSPSIPDTYTNSSSRKVLNRIDVSVEILKSNLFMSITNRLPDKSISCFLIVRKIVFLRFLDIKIVLYTRP